MSVRGVELPHHFDRQVLVQILAEHQPLGVAVAYLLGRTAFTATEDALRGRLTRLWPDDEYEHLRRTIAADYTAGIRDDVEDLRTANVARTAALMSRGGS